tara:strand:- start:366 stop:653 length:288 start_codon:yes stop_codon:yes gene_type:complete
MSVANKEISFYEHSDFTAFGVKFHKVAPKDVFLHFIERSPFLRDEGLEGYLEHVNQYVELPVRLTDESDVRYYDRVFDVLVKVQIVTGANIGVYH